MDVALSPADIDDLLTLARDVALACGRLIVDDRPRELGVAATKSSDNDVVTVMDRRSEELAHAMLLGRRPEDGIVGEEGAARVGTSGVTWLVDPIDATVNYLYDIEEYAVSVAAVVGDARVAGGFRPVVGVVHQPCTGELFVAASGRGATVEREGRVRRLAASPAGELAHSLVGTGFGYRSEDRAWQAEKAARVIPAARDIRRHGCASLDLCSVAHGRLDAYYEWDLHEWDYAAGWIIAEEAGLVVRGEGGGLPGHLLLAGRPEVLDELEALLS